MRTTLLLLLLIAVASGAVLLAGLAGLGPGDQSARATLLSQVKKLVASDGQAALFGVTVAISGDTAVVGALFEDTRATDAGAAYVFQRDQGGADGWGEVKKLVASDAHLTAGLGWRVALSGDTALVGDAGVSSTDPGAAYVFQRDEGGVDQWGEVKKLIASDPQVFVEFGWSVALSGDTAVVGAPFKMGGGAAYVFGRDEGGAGNWGEVTKITASGRRVADNFGRSVAVSDDTAVMGALGQDSEGDLAGAAYVFGRDEGGAGNWGNVKKLTASDAQSGDRFGAGVAVSGDTAIVGAEHEDAVGSDAGAAYVFQAGGAGDSDGDGCSDTQENGPSEVLGGRRDYLSFWDFFDVPVGGLPRDRAVNVFDIGAVVLRFGAFVDPPPTKEEALAQALTPPADMTSYHAAYDRGGPIPGQNLWNLRPPDGPIDAFDIGAVVVQFGHTCV